MSKISTARLKSLLFSNPPPENYQRIEQIDQNGKPLVIVLDGFGDGAILLEEQVHRIRFRTLPDDLLVEPSDFEKIDAACRQITSLPAHFTSGGGSGANIQPNSRGRVSVCGLLPWRSSSRNTARNRIVSPSHADRPEAKPRPLARVIRRPGVPVALRWQSGGRRVRQATRGVPCHAAALPCGPVCPRRLPWWPRIATP